MLPGTELLACHDLAVPREVMEHVVRVESSFNPYAIGVVGGRLARQPRSLPEAVATARMLERKGYNFSLGLAQVNRHNLARYGLNSYARAFEPCPNLRAGARILAECHQRAGGHWGKAFSCYYSGDFVTGYRHGYVQKIFASMRRPGGPAGTRADAVALGIGRTTEVVAGRVDAAPVDVPAATPPAITRAQARIARSAAGDAAAVAFTGSGEPAIGIAIPTASAAGAADPSAPSPQARALAAESAAPTRRADAAFVF
ncbi:lytic transglycosylase domain-containing protein [Vulcaniibacterium gelatinicum]|uniref:lytic transglycosylase domain-containing protein n=1 Tax=Vulcaniibacterium gelatinicum TaxID=2598725 RepID=UPI0011C99EB6|nr:lytic transglycosylase domain-containing protein [Vulcaniibacterium gelatinicum]